MFSFFLFMSRGIIILYFKEEWIMQHTFCYAQLMHVFSDVITARAACVVDDLKIIVLGMHI
jgi:hypothetical protein